VRRGELIRARREDLLRLAAWLHLRIEPSWSNKHIASLVYWRVTRHQKRLWRAARAFFE
jgi:hypothetical protein